MAVKIGHASISEHGTVNGAKGDSTKKEVCTRDWYSKPWDYMAVHPDAAVRERHAAAIEAACANNNIGYGQGDRNTLNARAKEVGYNLSKVGPCNCDCSSLQNVAAVASKAPGVTYASNGWTTSSMKAKLKAAGYKIIEDKAYLTSERYCVRGAMYVREGSHTVTGLENGAKADETLAKAGISAGSTTGGSSNSGSTNSGSTTKALAFKVGDVVQFTGNKHYSSASAAKGKTCAGGKATVTAVYPKGKHPYHLVRVNGAGSTVYGWVDADEVQEIGVIGIGDVVQFTGARHYTSANADTGKGCKPGKATVTAIKKGAKHPYHLVRVRGKGSTVYGWVDANKVSK